MKKLVCSFMIAMILAAPCAKAGWTLAAPADNSHVDHDEDLFPSGSAPSGGNFAYVVKVWDVIANPPFGSGYNGLLAGESGTSSSGTWSCEIEAEPWPENDLIYVVLYDSQGVEQACSEIHTD